MDLFLGFSDFLTFYDLFTHLYTDQKFSNANLIQAKDCSAAAMQSSTNDTIPNSLLG